MLLVAPARPSLIHREEILPPDLPQRLHCWDFAQLS